MSSRTLLAVVALVAAAGLIAIPFGIPLFWVRVLQNIFFGAALATAWNILGGFAGYWSFGHAGFLGLGAFMAALLPGVFTVGAADPILGFVAAAAVSAAFAALIAYPMLRLKGPYFALTMFALFLVLSEISSSVDWVGGSVGLFLPAIGTSWLAPELFFYFVFLSILVVYLGIAVLLKRSRVYYGLVAIREDEDAAPMLGVPVTYYKCAIFILSAAMTGGLGSVFAYNLGYITTQSAFRMDLNLEILIYCLLGGIGTLTGPVLGAALMTVLTQVVLGNLLTIHLMITGVLVVVLVLTLPKGIMGALSGWFPARQAEKPQPAAEAVRHEGIEDRPAALSEEPVLAFDDIGVEFRGLKALQNVTLQIPRGVIASIIGPNGAGKSTLFNVVTGYIRPTTGQVRYAGLRIDGRPTAEINRIGVGRAFQISRPFHGLTVWENVYIGALFGKPGRSDPRATTDAALALVGLGDLRNESATSLPVGHLRRLELARVIATGPDIVLADEPCAGLNATETAEIVSIFKELKKRGVTIVLVEHDMNTVMRVSDTIFVISAGRQIASGTADEVSRNPGVIEAYLGTPKATVSGVLSNVQPTEQG